MAKFELGGINTKPDADYSTEDAASKAARADGDKVRSAFSKLNEALDSGTLKIPKIENKTEDKYEAATILFFGGMSPSELKLFSDYTGKKEAGFRLTLDDKTEIVVPVTPTNINALASALDAAGNTALELKKQIGPQNPGSVDDISSKVFGKLKQDLGQFIRK